MKNSNRKTKHFQTGRKLSRYLCAIAVLSMATIFMISGQSSLNDPITVCNEPVFTPVPGVEQETEFTIFDYLVRQSALFTLVSNVLKASSDTEKSIIQNTR